MFNKTRLKFGFRIIFALGLLAFLLFVTPIALSKYEQTATSTANVGIAFYLLNADYYTSDVKLLNLKPQDDPYIYTFKIANFKDARQSEVNLTYDLSIKTTTNLPLTFALYMNYDTNNNIITGDNTAADADGTYFRILTTDQIELLYTNKTENIYTLYVYFPSTYNNLKYQDLVDNIEIDVDSKQVVT